MKHFTLLFIVVLIVVAQGCTGRNTKTDIMPGETVEEQIAKEFDRRKIVMLGDFCHNHPLPYRSLVDTLDTWLRMRLLGKIRTSKLTLVLECFDDQAARIMSFCKTGNWQIIYSNPYLALSSLADLEFFASLRILYKKLEQINRNRPRNGQLKFHILAGETKVPGRDHWDNDRSTRFFVYKRDVLIANKIKRYLSKNPDHKLLIFYGNAHLYNTLKRKTWPPYKLKLYGYYLSYHLKKIYSESSVLSVNQVLGRYLQNWKFSRVSIFKNNSDLTWKNQKRGKDYDKVIIRAEKWIPSHPLLFVYSKKVGDIVLKYALSNKKNTGHIANYWFRLALNRFQWISGVKYTSSLDFIKKYNTRTLNLFNRLNDPSLFKKLHIRLRNKFPKKWLIKRILRKMGFNKTVVIEVLNHPWRKESQAIWKASEKQFRTLQAIGINWIGYPEERSWAKGYLKKIGAPDFKEPHKYLRWWRMKHYGTKY